VKIAVLSDIHSNLVALEAVLSSLPSVDAVWHTGDVVGYGPEPQAVVERLIAAGALGVRGNHDDAAAGGASIESFNPDGYRAMVWTRRHIDEGARQYLAALPERLVPEGSTFTLVHGSPRDPIWEYLDSTPAARDNLGVLATPHCLVGHTHVPRLFRESGRRVESQVAGEDNVVEIDGRRLIVNPGSVGQPRDGDPRSSYVLIDTAAATIAWRRIRYDIVATQSAMRAAGLPEWLADRLKLGR